jgi:hypothetical protein
MSFGEQPAQATSDNLDNPETLQLLLQTITQNMTDDWTQMSTWADDKQIDLAADFNFNFPMDLDFDPTMAVDPSALHFNTSMFTQPSSTASRHGTSQSDEVSMTSMFSWPEDNSSADQGIGRRLSITSSSSSGASLSPIIAPQPYVSSSASSASSDIGDYSFNESDPAVELAHRVRQSSGVTLAVPVSPQVQKLAAANNQAKVAIPRIVKPSHPPTAKRALAMAVPTSPPGSSPTSSPAASPSDSYGSVLSNDTTRPQKVEMSVVVGASGRPKTSHTTIERRYRTNLNARITGLKQAVPALRVLELKNGIQSPYSDVVDARGFVDGVKVARKMSKANVLGKATEYIR